MQIVSKKEDLSVSQRPDLREFQHMVLLWSLIVESVACVAWQIFENNQLILLLAVLVNVLAFWLLTRSLRLCGLAWAGALMGVVSAAVITYESPLYSFVLCFLPLFAVILFGYLEGIFIEGLLFALMLFLGSRVPGLAAYTSPVVGGGMGALVFGAIFRYWILDLVGYFHAGYLYAKREIDESREQRLELKQVQVDLLHANRELTRLTRQLKIASQAAEEARRAKETFVATVSHELRTPLNMIIGFSEVIAQSPQVYGLRLPPTLLADIASIQRNSQHLLELVNDVLDLSQVDMGNLSISRSRCPVQGIIAEAIEVIHPLYQSKGLFLNAVIQEGIGEVFCDQTRIREVVINLLSNAGRFTEKGGVTVKAWLEEGQLILAVQDSGPGIARKDQERVFEPFQQLDDTIHRKHGGSGLGLAISKRFVEMHNGKMWLESEPGKGTTFFFSLPMLRDEAETGEDIKGDRSARWINPYAVVDARTQPFKAPAGTLVPRCVVIEEGRVASHLFERYLDGVEFASFADVDEALQSLDDSPAQLLVVNHPAAVEIQKKIIASEQLPFNAPLVAFWLPGSEDMAATLQAQEYLVKPVGQEDLLKALERTGRELKTILLVDDNPEVLQLFGRILSSSGRGYKVLRASDGQQALDMLRRRRPDVMILDLIMPDQDGFEVMRVKNADPRIREIPTIIISAQDPVGAQRVHEEITIARAGGFSPRELLGLIQSAGFLAS